MKHVVIASAVRTPVATARKGSLVHTRAEELARLVLSESISRAGVSPALIDDILFAESMYGGGAIARYAANAAGLPHVAGAAVNRHCSGSLATVGLAAGSIISGMERVVVAGGVQSTSTAPVMRYRVPGTVDQFEERWAPPTHPDSSAAPNRDMSITVGWNTAKAVGLLREEMDAWAMRSHQRALAAIDSGLFNGEIVPVMALQTDGSERSFEVDEHPRRDTTLEKLASLKVLHPEIAGFSITAGNSSGVNDAAAALVLADGEIASAEGLPQLGRVMAWTSIGIDPALTGLAVVDVIRKLLARGGVKQDDIALWEINEAFASVPLAACRLLGIDEETVNIHGSGCSIGHPVAASGGRMLTTLLHDLNRRGGGLGVAAMCAGGGQAGAVLVQV